jgi:hypothetical protein
MHTHDDDDDDDDYGDLFDITRNKHGGEQYSVAANADAAPTKAKLRALVYAYIYAQGVRGATADEAAEALGLTSQTCSPRFTELKKDMVIIHAGCSRSTRSGSQAGVYVAAEFARFLLIPEPKNKSVEGPKTT